MITLRPYQQKIIDGIQHYWKKGLTKLMVFSCTRSGKTIVFTYMAKKANEKGTKVLILTNRKKLFSQTGNALTDFNIHPFYISAETKTIRNDYMTYIAMSQTLQNRIKKPEFIKWFESIKLIVVDESHLQDVGNILQNPLCKDKYILGFSGSPMRGGSQRELSEDYQQIVIGPYTVELEPKYCVPARVFEVPFDMSGVKKDHNGEFSNSETFQRFDSPKVYLGAVNNWMKHANGLVTLVYCVNILHAAKTCVEFNKNGIKSKFISSGRVKPKLPENPNKGDLTKYRIASDEFEYIESNSIYTGEAETIIQEWERGDFLVLVNVDMLTFGYDNAKIDCVLLNRATNSVPLFLQTANRGGTPRPGKDHFVLLDMGGNSERLKDYNFRHEWNLRHKVAKGGGGVPASKSCCKCEALIIASARVCDWCGTEQPKSKQQQEIELIERKPVKELDTVELIEQFAKIKGHSKLWVFRSVYFKFGEEAYKKYMRSKNYHWSYIYRIMATYAKKHTA